MFTIQVTIKYTDGRIWNGSLATWADAPSEGIDTINAGGTQLSGDSIYYCQVQDVRAIAGEPAKLAFVVGSYAPYHKTRFQEVVFCSDGTAIARWCYFPPDLKISEVKLGWWKGDAD